MDDYHASFPAAVLVFSSRLSREDLALLEGVSYLSLKMSQVELQVSRDRSVMDEVGCLGAVLDTQLA
jgi:hypothetical protein